MLKQLSNLSFKWKQLVKLMPSLLAAVSNLRAVLCSPAEAYSGPIQASEVGLFYDKSKRL